MTLSTFWPSAIAAFAVAESERDWDMVKIAEWMSSR
jgi:hypothetical protein